MKTLTINQVRARLRLKCLREWAAELRESNDCDQLRMACELEEEISELEADD